MRKLLVIIFCFPLALEASLIGGSGSFGEEFIFTLITAGVLFLVSQGIKYSKRIKALQAPKVLPDFDQGGLVPGFLAENLSLVPELFTEEDNDFELFWSMEAPVAKVVGKVGFLHYQAAEKTVQLSFEIVPAFAAVSDIPRLIHEACQYVWKEWTEDELETIIAFIEESDLIGEALLESLNFSEWELEGSILEFRLNRYTDEASHYKLNFWVEVLPILCDGHLA